MTNPILDALTSIPSSFDEKSLTVSYELETVNAALAQAISDGGSDSVVNSLLTVSTSLHKWVSKTNHLYNEGQLLWLLDQLYQCLQKARPDDDLSPLLAHLTDNRTESEEATPLLHNLVVTRRLLAVAAKNNPSSVAKFSNAVLKLIKLLHQSVLDTGSLMTLSSLTILLERKIGLIPTWLENNIDNIDDEVAGELTHRATIYVANLIQKNSP